MELLRLSAPLANLPGVPGFVRDDPRTVVFECRDGDTVISVGSLGDEWPKPLGVWLHVSGDYPAQLAARDVATLSWLVDLDHVVVDAEDRAESYAEVVRALLTDDEVNFSNDVAHLAKAFNRPAPPRPLTVWSYDGTTLRSADAALCVVASASMALGELTTFA